METVLKTKGLCKSFETAGVQQQVIKNIDFEIYKGDFTVIMGASGSGKSTLLYALSGMDKPTSGSVIADGMDLAGLTQDQLAKYRSKNCGFVFQQIYLVDSMSVLDNVLVGGMLVNKDKKAVKEDAEKIIKSVGIEEDTFKKLPNMLSGGQAQRVGVARAAVNKPNILFVDEPTGALNSQNAKSVLDVLTAFNRAGQSIVMVTHDPASARRANRILYLMDGQIKDELKLDVYDEKDARRDDAVCVFLAKQGW